MSSFSKDGSKSSDKHPGGILKRQVGQNKPSQTKVKEGEQGADSVQVETCFGPRSPGHTRIQFMLRFAYVHQDAGNHRAADEDEACLIVLVPSFE